MLILRKECYRQSNEQKIRAKFIERISRTKVPKTNI